MFYDDGEGPGYVRRHNESELHLISIQKAQQKAHDMATGYKPWAVVAVGEEEYERLELRRALEALQKEEGS